MSNSTLILGATMVNEGQIQPMDLFIKNDRIEAIGPDLSHQDATHVIDAEGLHLLPGVIDDQVHFREPGLTHKGSIQTESRAAVAGGITSYMEMPNVKPITDSCQALEDKYHRASQKSLANFGFYLGATHHNLETIKRLTPQDCCGVKVFMGSSTGNMLVDDPAILSGIFAHCPKLVVTHCEDSKLIGKLEQQFRDQYGDDVPIDCHPDIRSRQACINSSSLAVNLAKQHGTNLHVLHLTTQDELALFTAGDIDTKKITAEVCVHHLTFSDKDYATLGTLIKCNPAIKAESDRLALIDAVLNDTIDIIATDHAPHTLAEKQSTYFNAPSGLPLVQHMLPQLLSFYQDGIFSLEKIVHKTAHAVATRYKIKDRGFLREGYFADCILVDLNAPWQVTQENTLYKCGWSAFEGNTFGAAITKTFVNGHLVYDNGRFDASKYGMRMAYHG